MSKEKDLQKEEPRALAPSMDDPWDETADEFLPDKLPNMKIGYPNSKDKPENLSDGHLYNNLTGTDYGMEVEAVVLWIEGVRQGLWPRQYAEDNRYVCNSDNGLEPTGGTEPLEGPCRRRVIEKLTKKSRLIDVCPKLQWQDGEEGERIPPECTTYFPMLLYLPAYGEAVIFRPHNEASGEVRSLKSMLKMLKGKMEPDPRHPDLPVNYRTTIKINIMRKRSKKGSYFVPKILIGQPFDEGVGHELRELTPGLRQALAAMTMEELGEVEEDATPF